MESVTVRIDIHTRDRLRELSEEEKRPQAEILAQALEEYRRKRFLEKANQAYAALRADPEAFWEEQEERALWENTLPDGLEKKQRGFGQG